MNAELTWKIAPLLAGVIGYAGGFYLNLADFGERKTNLPYRKYDLFGEICKSGYSHGERSPLAESPASADNAAPLKGLFYGGGMQVLIAQAIGSVTVTIATFASAYVVMYVVNAMGVLRVTAEGEARGLDLHEHGISAYPEYVISSTPSPASMVAKETGKLVLETRTGMASVPAQ